MDDKMIDDLFQLYEKEYGFKIKNAEDLFTAQGNLLKYIMKMGITIPCLMKCFLRQV